MTEQEESFFGFSHNAIFLFSLCFFLTKNGWENAFAFMALA